MEIKMVMIASAAKGRYTNKIIECGYVIDEHGVEHPLANYPEVKKIFDNILRKSLNESN